MIRARKPKVTGTRRKGGLKLRRKGKKAGQRTTREPILTTEKEGGAMKAKHPTNPRTRVKLGRKKDTSEGKTKFSGAHVKPKGTITSQLKITPAMRKRIKKGF
jgi:hypothetical protein